jgi:protease-4
LGTEADAKRWCAELVGLNPDKAKFYTIKPPRTLANRLLNRNTLLERLSFELETNGMPLWLWR